MKLSTRLSLFYLSMLTVVLLGFSCALYALGAIYLNRQVDERIDTSLKAISNIIEAGDEGVEWEPGRRTLDLNSAIDGEQLVWLVGDDQGHVLDQSKGQSTAPFLEDTSPTFELHPDTISNRKWQGNSWKAAQRWIHPDPGTIDLDEESSEQEHTHKALSVTVGVSLAPLKVTLANLATALSGISILLWLIALILGRFVCQQALLPVHRMAIAATDIGTQDLSRRLPVVATQDELGDLNLAFNQLLDRLQVAFERQQRFTAEASHQLRTPLTAILGQIEVALRRERSINEYQAVLEKVQSRASHLSRMTEGLLFLARADAEARLPVSETINLSTWLPEHLKMWSEHARYKDMNLVGVDEPCTIQASTSLLAELLDILIDNACKYSDPNTPITLRLGQDETTVSISIEDRGYGIPVAEIADVFEPFIRLEEARRRGIKGTGLGLSIAKRLAQAFDAKLQVTSSASDGTIFRVSFPSTNR